MKPTQFYFASTPLNILLACSIAKANQVPNRQAVLLLIDQTLNETQNLYYQAILKWPDSPFTQVFILSFKQKSLLNKIAYRKQVLQQINTLILQYQPCQLFTGNDRRIEFQYAHSLMLKKKPQAFSTYYEDGLFSYLPRKAKWIENWISRPVNRLVYGNWRELPESAGFSSKINQVYAAFPDLICSKLKQKKVVKLPNNFASKPMQALACQLLNLNQHMSQAIELQDCAMVLILPHESNYQNIDRYKQKIMALLPAKHKPVLIKYHPRNTTTDALNLAQLPQITLLNPLIPFEFYLPYFKQTKIVGDLSAALLTSKWLRPELEVACITPAKDDRRSQLYKQLGIQFLV